MDQFSGAGLAEGVTMHAQLLTQLYGVGITVTWTIVFTLLALWITTFFTRLRVQDSTEDEGLDEKAHGEKAYTIE